ncbi:MAG: Gfo/Idh/MocA family protein [Candidatus Aminicenantales bacterium]
MKDRPVSVILVGLGGMGRAYLECLLEEFPRSRVWIQAAVDPFLRSPEVLSRLKAEGIPLVPSLSETPAAGRRPDCIILCSPIQHHVPQACEALSLGAHVLCEKPLGATVQEANRLIQAKNEAHGWVMVGYQWSFSRAIRGLKKDILRGAFGRPLRFRTLCLWPRDQAYYRRNDWAGRLKDPEGAWVLDSPANNAMAHFLHNLFFLLGDRMDESAFPEEVTAELYRAYPVENFDTVACRARTRGGVEVLFYASHAVSQDVSPRFVLEFEGATVRFGEDGDEIAAFPRSGTPRVYGSPESEHPLHKLFVALQRVRVPGPVVCGPEAARAQTLCVNGIQDSRPEIVPFPETLIQKSPGEDRLWVEGLGEVLCECYRKALLPSETDVRWAAPGKRVNLRNYRYFPGGQPPRGRAEVGET